MKIIHFLAGKANPERTQNGVNVVVDAYACRMFEAGYDVEVWGIADNPNTNLSSPKYPLRLFQHYHTWPLRLDPGLVECIRNVDSPTTVFHFYSGFLRSYPAIAGMLHKSQYFCMPQGIYSDACLRRNRFLKAGYIAIYEKGFLCNSRGLLLANEKELSDSLAKHIERVPKYVVPNGADVTIENNERATYRNIATTVWGFCGRIDNAQKGVDKLVRCFLQFARLHEERKHILLLIGDGPDLPQIKSSYADEIRNGLIEVHGRLFDTEKEKQLNRMDFFAHLSNWEGVPLACLEAVSRGIPLLVTPGTNLADDVRAYGAGVATEPSEDAILRAMEHLANSDLRGLIGGCKRLIKDKYNWTRSCTKLLDLYQRAVSS